MVTEWFNNQVTGHVEIENTQTNPTETPEK